MEQGAGRLVVRPRTAQLDRKRLQSGALAGTRRT